MMSTHELTNSSVQMAFENIRVEYVSPDGKLWLDLIKFIGIITIYLIAVGTATFYCLKRINNRAHLKKAILIFIWLFGMTAPTVFMHVANVSHLALRFLFTVTTILAMFKQVEAIIGTTPPGVLDHLGSWLLYFSSIVEPTYENARPLKPKPGERTKYVKLIFWKALLLSALMSVGFSSKTVMLPFGFLEQFHPESQLYSLAALIGNNAFHALLLYLILGKVANLLALVLCLLGYRPMDLFRNPLLESQSPRDFWGKRWNMVIHGILKRTYYHPVQRRFGPAAGAAVAFAMSGLFHEFQWYMLLLEKREDVHQPGELLIFFLLMFILCTLPWPDIKSPRKKWWMRPLLTVATVFPGLCVSQFFTKSLLKAEFFEECSGLSPIFIMHFDK